MSEKKLDSKMEQIQALLNTAASLEDENPAAARSYREKAERLMEKYSIEDAMLAKKREAEGVADLPSQRHITFCRDKDELNVQYYNLLIAIANHNKCQFIGFSNGTGYLVGFEKDMDLVEMVYASVRLQLITKIDPKPDSRKSFDQNVYDLHEAGINWRKIAYLMNEVYDGHDSSGILSALDPKWEYVPWDVDSDGKGRKDGGRLIRAAKRWCKDNGLTYRAVQTPVTFRRSYAHGYLRTIQARLAEMRQHRKDERKSSGAELVLVTRATKVDNAFDQLKSDLGISKDKAYKINLNGEAYYRGAKDGKDADLSGGRNNVSRGAQRSLEA